MKKFFRWIVILSLCPVMSPAAFATNGDNLIAIGPTSRAMGGVGIAYPMDAIGAVFSNPAAMCFGPYCPASQFDFSGTAFMPSVEAKLSGPGVGGTVQAESDDSVYPIPAIGVSVPVTHVPPYWRFGLAAYGVTGLGVDYRDTVLDNSAFAPFGGAAPAIQGEYTQLQIMKFAPSIAFQPHENWSFGLALHIGYGNLDLKQGSSSGYALGLQGGVIFKPAESLFLGLTYITPQSIDHDKVREFDQPPNGLDTLTLEAPQQLGFGLAYSLPHKKLLMEADVKWLNWSDADGYSDFDWEDQWVFAFGLQYEPIPKLFLRAGYNYGKNPVKEHNGFDGGFGPTGLPNSSVNVQGHLFPAYYYETYRIIGFPAIVEHHLTFGIGYEFSPSFGLHLGYVHGFEKTISERGTAPNGLPVTVESTLSERSIDFGFSWRF